MRGALRRLRGRRVQQRDVVREVQRHPPVPLAERRHAHPGHLAGRAQQVEVLRPVAGQPRGQHVGLQRAGRDRRALQLLDHVEQRVGPSARRRAGAGDHAVPVQEQARECFRGRGLDFLPEPRQRSPPQGLQDLGVAPLAAGRAGGTRPPPPGRPRPGRGGAAATGRDAGPEPLRHVRGGERPVRPRVARDQLAQGIGPRLQERARQPPRRLAEPDMERFARALSGLGKIDQELLDAVIAEFLDLLTTGPEIAGGSKMARKLLAAVMDDEDEVNRLIEGRARSEVRSVWERLNDSRARTRQLPPGRAPADLRGDPQRDAGRDRGQRPRAPRPRLRPDRRAAPLARPDPRRPGRRARSTARSSATSSRCCSATSPSAARRISSPA